MTTTPPARYQPELDLVNRIMSEEVAQVPWANMGEVEKIIREQLARQDPQLRPLLALAVADALGARLDRVCAPAASLEFHHLAALALDDVPGDSSVGSDAPAAHTAEMTNLAINISSTMRSLAYHPIHRAESLGPGEKLSLHRELDRAATEVALGKSIDIGWQLGWYQTYADFPYDQMIRWKTGSMFGCAAAMGARVANARPAAVESARHLGGSLGALHQMVDDYLNVFGEDQYLRRPRYGDFRARKMSGPVVALLRRLTSADRQDEAKRVEAAFASGTDAGGWDWLVELMDAQGIGELLRGQFSDRARSIETHMSELCSGGDAAGLRMVLDLIVTPLRLPDPDRSAAAKS